MTIGIHDYDFFHYEYVVPNLDCARLITYYRNKRQIAVLSPSLNPSMYTKFILRKEYNDGIFPQECFLPNVTYGGRAFSPEQYKPFLREIEDTIPDMHIYDKYIQYFSPTKKGQELVKRILNCAHIRLAPDSIHARSFEELKPYFVKGISGIFLHDYDISNIDGALDIILELQNQRPFKEQPGINYYPVGNKFPIRVYNNEDLKKWFQIVTIPNSFCLEYCGLLDDENLNYLCVENSKLARQLYYNISYGCYTEDQFLKERLPKIFMQTLFLRRNKVKILLKYEDGFFKIHELESIVKLLNCWLSLPYQEYFMPGTQSLFRFVRDAAKLHYVNWCFRRVDVSTDESRDAFQYVREHNYDLFKKFYECDAVIFKGGKIIDERTGN